MTLNRKAVGLVIGLTAILSIVTIAEAQKPAAGDLEYVIEDARIDWYQMSNVSALTEGVIDKLELRRGMEVDAKGVIGYLHKEKADLAVKEAEIQARGEGAVLKALAQKRLARAVIMRNMRLASKGEGFVPAEEREKAEAEYEAADASWIEAKDTQELAKAKLESARQAAEEHIIRAPFSGQILDEYKHAGESVRANEPVVKIGNLETVEVWGFLPIEYMYRVAPGSEVIVQIRLGSTRGKQSIEQKQFRGVITSVDQSIQSVGETTIKIYAKLENPTHELKPGLNASMSIRLKPDSSNSFTAPVSPRATSTGVGNRQAELPALPPR
jgi:multidrug efflux pump subunit AcrA (membrane-fusion protein)